MLRSILFFCAANTCRSPLAQVMAADLCADAGDLRFVSAGLYAAEGSPASAGSCVEAAARGLDLSRHGSRPLDDEALAGVDWVIGMTADHVATFLDWHPGFAGRVGQLGQPGVDLARGGEPRADGDVTDPHLGGPGAYAAMAARIEDLLRGWRPALTEEKA